MQKIQAVKTLKYEILIISILICIVSVYFGAGGKESIFLLIASILGLYMAMNIGANDIANNMGPAVGSKALTIVGAIVLAVIAEASGAIIAGGDVVNTIKGGIIQAELISGEPKVFLSIMMATLIGAALWINLATIFKAPVSATHSIIGALIGAGVTAAGFGIVNWLQISSIVASWIISPVMGGTIAILFMLAIRKTIFSKEEIGEAAKQWVPVFIGIMACVFSLYLMMKGLKKVYSIRLEAAIIGAIDIGLIIYSIMVYKYKNETTFFKNSKKFINKLFNIPLIFAVGLLSFAHGANDVANAIGPLAAINDIIKTGAISAKSVGIPFWILGIGAFGLAMGLAVFGARLIKTVGSEITKLNQSSAFAVALSAAITVIIASHLGLPVSSTHIAIGGIFGIGILKEYRKRRQGKTKDYIEKKMIKSIILAWIITLPISALIAGFGFIGIMNFL